MAKRKTPKKSASVIVRDPSVPKADKAAVQAALQATFWLQGNLKSTRMAYLRVAGKLAEVRKWRKQDNSPENSLKKMISSFRLLRKRAAALKNMPPEAVRYLDEAIEVLVHDKVLQTARLSPVRLELPKSSQNYIA